MNTPNEKPSEEHILETPVWVFAFRIAQALLALIILGLAAALMHDAYLDEEGLALAISIFTWLFVGYIVLSSKIGALKPFYHIVAVIVLDGLMVILWLSTFAATAARRAGFVYDVSVSNCYDDGSVIDSKTCFRKRNVILFKSGASMLAAIAGLGALVWLLFVATFTWTMVMFFRGRKEGRFLFETSGAPENHQMEAKPTQQAVVTQQPIQPQPTGPYTYQAVPDAQAQYPQGVQSPQSPYQQQGGYPAPDGSYPQQQQQQYYPQQAYPQQPMQPQMTGQSYQTSPSPAPVYQQQQPYGSELDAQATYAPSAPSPAPQQHHQ